MQTKSHSLLGKIKSFFVRLKRGVHRFWAWYKHLYSGQPWWKKTIVGILSFFSLLLIISFGCLGSLLRLVRLCILKILLLPKFIAQTDK